MGGVFWAVYEKIFKHFMKKMDDTLDRDTRTGIVKQVLSKRDKMSPEHRK